MSQRWLKFLKTIGSPSSAAPWMRDDSSIGENPPSWEACQQYDLLFTLYGPLSTSPWAPYQCPTIFASIERLNLTPLRVELSPAFYAPRPEGAWEWLKSDTMVLLELGDTMVIEVGVTLMREANAQLVSTFDHWPRPRTGGRLIPIAVNSTGIINTMATLAPEAHAAYQRLTPESPPVWLCDRRRLGSPHVARAPGDFDNRYYIDDSILPGVNTFKKGGIRRVVYFSEDIRMEPNDDL
ncbi:MAG: hypothetical protein ACNA8W_17795, partial [Bradymonadaceae bacterium]